MSKIRLWKLGKITDNPETCVLPTASSISKFKSILCDAMMSNDKVVDLVWGPDLECIVIDESVVDVMLMPVIQEDGSCLYKLENLKGENNGSSVQE